jgi:hypothetical protein
LWTETSTKVAKPVVIRRLQDEFMIKNRREVTMSVAPEDTLMESNRSTYTNDIAMSKYR